MATVTDALGEWPVLRQHGIEGLISQQWPALLGRKKPDLQLVFICVSVTFRARAPSERPKNAETRSPGPGSATN